MGVRTHWVDWIQATTTTQDFEKKLKVLQASADAIRGALIKYNQAHEAPLWSSEEEKEEMIAAAVERLQRTHRMVSE